MKDSFKKESFFSVPKKELFEFHERDDAFHILTPASAGIDVESVASTLAPSDDIVKFAAGIGPIKFRFENIHTVYEPHNRFVDEQQRGLFTAWRHEHRFKQAGWDKDPASMLTDEIKYAHPLLPTFNPFVRLQLRSLFDYRHTATAKEVHMNPDTKDEGLKRVVVTGATGLIGKRIVEILLEKSIEVVAFVRNQQKAEKLFGGRATSAHWDFHSPEEGDWKDHLGQADGVIHLAGTPLFKKRWNAAFKEEMEQSRVQSTKQLVEAIIESDKKPRVFVSASAMGYYGTDHSLVVDEEAAPGDDLLARICVNWENEALKLRDHGVRTVQMRIGIVLSTESGALKELLPMFKLGVGGTVGDPNPYINWIHIEDVARMFTMALQNDEMRGPYNAVGPAPVTNGEFAKTIARVLRRPSLMRVPTTVLKTIIGEAGEYASGGPMAKVDRITDSGYQFFFSDLERALGNLLVAR